MRAGGGEGGEGGRAAGSVPYLVIGLATVAAFGALHAISERATKRNAFSVSPCG